MKNPKNISIPNDSIPIETVRKTFQNFKNITFWKYFFKDKGKNRDYNPKFKLIPKPEASIFPDKLLPNLNHQLIADINDMERQIEAASAGKQYKLRNRIDHIRKLQNKHPDTILTLADKNLGFVALYKTTYQEITLEHLQNPKTYRKTIFDTSTITKIVANRLHNLLLDLKSLFTDSESQFLSKQLTLPSNLPKFQSYPKMHKKGNLKSRPIITSFNWFTRPVALILNERLLALKLTLPYVIKSSKELADNIPRTLKPNEKLISIDIKAMYPSINRSQLLQAFQRIPNIDPTIITLLKFILKNCYCSFENITYLQLEGIPMGDNASVFLANFFCDALIDHHIASATHATTYYRYIDDIFMIWNSTREDLEEKLILWNDLSSCDFEITAFSDTNIDFLDLHIRKQHYTNILHTSVFFKPTSKFNYLSPTSCHPPHTLKGWIKAEITRHYLLTSHPQVRDINLSLFKERLLKRGYKLHFLTPIFNKVRSNYLLTNTTTNDNAQTLDRSLKQDILHIILPYYPDSRSQIICNIIKRNIRTITENHFPGHRPIIAYATLPSTANRLLKYGQSSTSPLTPDIPDISSPEKPIIPYSDMDTTPTLGSAAAQQDIHQIRQFKALNDSKSPPW